MLKTMCYLCICRKFLTPSGTYLVSQEITFLAAVTLTAQHSANYVVTYVCYHSYKCDDMCFDYMNGNICKHLHKIHTKPVDSVEEMELDVPDVDRVSTDNTEEPNETSNDPVNSYSFPCTSSTCKQHL